MTFIQQVARNVALMTLVTTADRYGQIAMIKQVLIRMRKENLATDRDTIDAVLDILYNDYAFSA